MPRYRSKRIRSVIKSGLSRLSVKNRRIRLRRNYIEEHELNETTVQDNGNGHSVADCNGEDLVTTAAEGLLMLQRYATCQENLVWPNRKSSPYIVSPLRRRADITTNLSEPIGADSLTPTSSHRISSTPLSPLVPVKNSLARKMIRRRLLAEQEFQNSNLSPVAKRPKNLNVRNIYCTPEKLSNLTESVTMNDNGTGSYETAITRSDLSSDSRGFTTMSGSSTTFKHSATQTDEAPSSVDFTTMSGSSTSFEHSTTQTDKTSIFSGGAVFTGRWRYNEMRSVTRKEFHRLTGLNQENFEVLYNFLGGDDVCNNLKYKYEARTPKKKRPTYLTVKRTVEDKSAGKTSLHSWKDSVILLSSKDKLFMTLVRLRRGFAVEDVALLFGLSKTQASKVLYVWVQFLNLQFKRIQREMCVSRHDQPKWKIAPCFRASKNFRMVLDTTEIRIQIPNHYRQQGNTYSAYKAWNVILYMIGISGWGSVSYVSPGFEGSMSDRAIFEKSGLKEYLEPGDLLLVDRGFTVKDIMDEVGVTVVHPPFTNKGKPLCPEDNMLTKRIGSDRSHVERAIRKIKCFNILKRATNKMLPILDQLVFVCACLTNFDANLLLVN